MNRIEKIKILSDLIHGRRTIKEINVNDDVYQIFISKGPTRFYKNGVEISQTRYSEDYNNGKTGAIKSVNII